MAWAGRHFYVGAWKSLRHGTADMNTLIAIGTGAAFALFRRRDRRAGAVRHGGGAAPTCITKR